MGLFQTNKPKSAGKIMIPHGEKLSKLVLDTLNHMAEMSGSTLGPGGRQVLIERSEMNMQPIITKDGVTVIKHLGYNNPIQQLVLESARNAALRTASEAGDGTTTATILSAAIANATNLLVTNNPKISPQSIVRELQSLVPLLKDMVYDYKIDATGDNFDEILTQVAIVSANHDEALADAVIDSFNTVGEEGNLTIIEESGPSRYKVEKITGYTVDTGYEESCKKFAPQFINDRSGTLVGLQRPVFVLYDGIIQDTQQVLEGLNRIFDYFANTGIPEKNIVLVAHGFSDIVLADLEINWNTPNMMKVFPLLTPQRAIINWRSNFLRDIQAYIGAPIFNPLDAPFSEVNPESLVKNNLVTAFEASRFRSSIISDEDTVLLEERIEQLKLQLEKPESQYEANDLEVRIGKLSSGIARLIISGPSQGETREKRDRAEDAWMAIRGAIKYGAVTGGGYVLVRLAAFFTAQASRELSPSKQAAYEILSVALLEPVRILYQNYGFTEEETEERILDILTNDDFIYDIARGEHVPLNNLLDSAPAVTEALESSISIASLLGTLGGVVSFNRDYESDKEEEKFDRNFRRTIGEE